MMTSEFRVLSIYSDKGSRWYVKASMIDKKSFAVSAGSTLNGVRISDEFFAEHPEGQFCFRLENCQDANKFEEGQIAVLETP